MQVPIWMGSSGYTIRLLDISGLEWMARIPYELKSSKTVMSSAVKPSHDVELGI